MGSQPKPTLTFSYGSNMWIDQMKRRCPEHRLIGVAKLEKWRWIIIHRGYANIVPSENDHIYGFVYEINEKDEETLDQYEGVPACYSKLTLPVELVKNIDFDVKDGTKMLDAMVYVDEENLTDGSIREEYIYRMNQAIADAVREGVPQEYIDGYLIPFIEAGKK
ncbi:aig2 family protein [Moniliophthora roreri MCA 2997]|uniref:gamma-glutamylcyclotransferase n=2 Tax=Moniliophthora roreri TaxID=221103 RepID=V2X7X9_MONRO|nr:aig2 family protein [Moniliophthora roreri MCA 2997]KAI3600018.1 aig2 family protein [Moniliophthora roreri]